MSTIKQKPPLSVKDIDRLSALAADVADHGRIAGLELGAMLEETVAESTELEAARLRYLRGEEAETEAEQLKAAAVAAKRRAEAYGAEAEKAKKTLDDALGGEDGKAPFRLEVSVRAGKEQKPVGGIDLVLYRGKTELGRAVSDEKGEAEFRIAADSGTEAAATKASALRQETVQRAIRQDVVVTAETGKAVRFAVVALDAKGTEIGRGGTDAVPEPGGSARIDISLG